jgi:adenosylcobinamide amidohydrolase
MNRWLPVIAVSAAFFVLSGCGSSESTRKGPTSPAGEQDRKVALEQIEKTFNPSDYDDEIEVIQKQHEFERERAAAEHQQDSVVVESELTQGFRIQIFATGSFDEANAMRQTAVQRLTEDSVYVVFDTPVYKVRVGDFRTRVEANQRLSVISALGFADGWVVGDKITIRRSVRVQPGANTRKR